MTISEQTAGQYHYEVIFEGDTAYARAVAVVNVAVGTLRPTTISVNTNIAHPSVGQSHTIFGKLTDANGTPLREKR